MNSQEMTTAMAELAVLAIEFSSDAVDQWSQTPADATTAGKLRDRAESIKEQSAALLQAVTAVIQGEDFEPGDGKTDQHAAHVAAVVGKFASKAFDHFHSLSPGSPGDQR